MKKILICLFIVFSMNAQMSYYYKGQKVELNVDKSLTKERLM